MAAYQLNNDLLEVAAYEVCDDLDSLFKENSHRIDTFLGEMMEKGEEIEQKRIGEMPKKEEIEKAPWDDEESPEPFPALVRK